MTITDDDLKMFRERAKTELDSYGHVERIAWDVVVDALCREVISLRKKSQTLGNSAAMRAALVSAIGTLKKLYAPSKRTAGHIVTCRQKCEAALATISNQKPQED